MLVAQMMVRTARGPLAATSMACMSTIAGGITILDFSGFTILLGAAR